MIRQTQPFGLYGWIQSNDGRSTGLFFAFLAAIQLIAPLALVGPLLLVDPGHAPFFGWTGYLLYYAPLVLIGSIGWFAAQLWWHVETVKRAVGFCFVDATDEPRLCRIIEPLIILTGLPVPFVGVIDSDARNAFACGIGRKKAVVVVTRGLIDALDDAELASVLAHELSHIRNGDIRLMAAANIFMTALTKLHARNALRFSPVHAVLALAVPALLPLSIAGSLIGRLALRGGQVSRLLITSSREFIADAEAAQWTQNPAALASALLKVDGRHTIAGARAEDDAMMIAGASEGTGATHPTIAQRVAALARVTGSMVFNAPSAPRDADWTANTTRDEVERMAFGPRALASDAIARVRHGDDENVLGLTRNATIALLLTIAALVGIHWDDLGNPRLMAAKFDPRPIAVMIGTPVACELSPFSQSFSRTCDTGLSAETFRAFEGQRGTLVGYLADFSAKRRGRRGADANAPVMRMGSDRVRTPWLGQSGRVRGMTATRGADGLYIEETGTFSSALPNTLVVAEIDQIGCFPWERAELGANGPDRQTLAGLVADAQWLALSAPRPSAPLQGYLDYLEQREALLGQAFDTYGKAGVKTVNAALAAPAHSDTIVNLRRVLKLGTPRNGVESKDLAELRALARDPAAFVPCASLA